MSDTKQVRILIESILKGQGFDAARRGLGDVKQGAKDTQSQLDALGYSASTLGAQLKGALAASVVTAFVRSSVMEFAKVERQINAVAFRLEALGISSVTVLPKVREALRGIAEDGGALESETIPAFSKFVGITKDAEKALVLTRLASDIAEAGTLDLATAAGALAGILQGRAALGAQTLGLELKKTNGEVKTGAELLVEARQQYGGLSDKLADTQNELDKANFQWIEFKKNIGSAFAPVIAITNRLASLSKVILDFRRVLFSAGQDSGAREGLAGFVTRMREAMGLEVAKLETQSDAWAKVLDQANRSVSADTAERDIESLLDLVDSESKKNKESLDAAAEAARKRTKASDDLKRAEEERYRAETEGLARVMADEQAAADAADQELQRSISRWDEYFRARNELAQSAEDELLQTSIEYAQRGTDEALALRLEQINREADAKVQAIERTVKEEAIAADSIAKIRKAAAIKIAAAEKETSDFKIGLRQAENEANIMAAQIAVGALAQAFPEVKAFAVAQALLNVYEAATKAAAAAGPAAPAAYAAVFAALIGVISTMRSITPGSTGSSSGGGAAVRTGPSRIQTGEGVTTSDVIAFRRQSRRDTSSPSVVQHITVRGSLIEKGRLMRDLAREVRRAERQDSERFIR